MVKKQQTKRSSRLIKIIPLLALAVGFFLFFYFDGASYISFETLKEQREQLATWVARLGIFAPIVYGGIYALVVAFSLPLGAVMTITAGFLFGVLVGSVTVVIGATIGAAGVFLAVKMGLGKSLTSSNQGIMAKMQEGFNRNAFSYMLVLRLIPVFPFALINILAAVLGVSFLVYFFGTLIGIIPGTVVYILLGNGLGAIFDAGGTPNLSIIFETKIIVPILGLAGLVLLQVVYTRIRDRRQNQADSRKSSRPQTKSKAKAKPSKKIKPAATTPIKSKTTKGGAKRGRGRPKKS